MVMALMVHCHRIRTPLELRQASHLFHRTRTQSTMRLVLRNHQIQTQSTMRLVLVLRYHQIQTQSMRMRRVWNHYFQIQTESTARLVLLLALHCRQSRMQRVQRWLASCRRRSCRRHSTQQQAQRRVLRQRRIPRMLKVRLEQPPASQ